MIDELRRYATATVAEGVWRMLLVLFDQIAATDGWVKMAANAAYDCYHWYAVILHADITLALFLFTVWKMLSRAVSSIS